MVVYIFILGIYLNNLQISIINQWLSYALRKYKIKLFWIVDLHSSKDLKEKWLVYTHIIVNDFIALKFLQHRNVLKFVNARIGRRDFWDKNLKMWKKPKCKTRIENLDERNLRRTIPYICVYLCVRTETVRENLNLHRKYLKREQNLSCTTSNLGYSNE